MIVTQLKGWVKYNINFRYMLACKAVSNVEFRFSDKFDFLPFVTYSERLREIQ